MKSDSSALYIHIPFCKYICTYCDFKKFVYNQERVDKYFWALFEQIKELKENKYKTIYIGGGTPSCIDYKNLEELLKRVNQLLDDDYKEFTIECNVENINSKFLALIVKYGVNRLSIGIQTFNDKYINLCGRKHTKEMAIKNVLLASTYLNNISVDMIYAFKDQTIDELIEDINVVCSLPIKHLSYYSLVIEDNTILKMKHYENVDDKTQAKMYKTICKQLKKWRFYRYEISNFSKYGKYQSKHNLVYWHNFHYDAIGLASSGYKANLRYKNNDNILRYIDKDFSFSEKIILNKQDMMFEEIMLRLRLDEGLDISYFNQKYDCDFQTLYKDAIAENLKLKLISLKKGKIKTTFKGSLLLNSVLERFM